MKIHHVGYAVKNMETSIEEFLKIGYKKRGETVADEARKVLIQFIPVNSIITKSGNTPYHICYSVDNIDEAIKKLKTEGYILMESPSGAVAIDFCKVAFLYNRDVGIIELVEESTQCGAR